MTLVNHQRVQIEEVTSVLKPAPGVTLDQALADAQLAGYQALAVDQEKQEATITWFKREPEQESEVVVLRRALLECLQAIQAGEVTDVQFAEWAKLLRGE